MDNIPFNLQSYKKRLSPFGQKVLQVLVNQWNSEKENERNREIQEQCETMDINGRNAPKVRMAKENGRKKCNLKFAEKEIPEIPVSPVTLYELNYNSLENDKPNKILCREDLVSSAMENHSKSFKREENEFRRDETSFPKTCIDSKRNTDPATNTYLGDSNNKNNISWSNMFDTELFQDKIENDAICNESKNFSGEDNIPFPADMVLKNPRISVTKRKSSTKTSIDQIPKKGKLESTELPNYRKERLTKSVKNWLNDVEQTLADTSYLDKYETSPVNETEDINFQLTSENKSLKNILPAQIDVHNAVGKTKTDALKEKTKKKVVQAQLANKDGIMKFKKPKNIQDDEAKYSSIKVNNDKESVKEKKNKTKFVAPIKSQTPVRDIKYNIAKVDGSIAISWKGDVKLQIYVVLIYSNGFCQLNGCYTEDTCVPEGILLYSTDKDLDYFYYFSNMDDNVRNELSLLLEQNDIICYEGKSLLIYLSNSNVIFKPLSIIDAKIGGALLEPENPPETFSDLRKLVAFDPEFTIATDCPLQKAAWYSTLLKGCEAKLRAALHKNSLWSVFVDLEMRLLPIIADMERLGIAVDTEELNSMEQRLLTRLKEVEQECYQAAGRSFQINSAPQVRALLYDELQLDTKCNLRVRETLVKGAKSTSEATLRSLTSVHALPGLVLEYRRLHKAHATFLVGIKQHVRDGVIRPTWVQTAAATGRIACSNPNLQAIPKAPLSLNMLCGPDGDAGPALWLRSLYVARAGCTLLAADFRHVECRVLAHAADDAALQAALAHDDLFRVLAAHWLNKSEADVSDADRERTKRIVYASVYGCGARKLADMLAVSYEQALAFLASFNRTFPSLKAFARAAVERCARAGELRSLCGRARRFPRIASADAAERAHAERQAVNFLVQGSAADLCKMAMVASTERLAASSPPLRARLLLQIHDELVWEVPEQELARTAAVVRAAMEGSARACGAALRLPVALAAAARWGRLLPLARLPA